MTSPFLYFPGIRLSGAELSAACLDGHLVALGDAYIPADAVETAALRAGSLHPLLGTRLAATHLSAAWVHGALAHPPARHRARRATTRRQRQLVDQRLEISDRLLAAADRVLLGGVWVASSVRTVIDLAREDDPASRGVAAVLLRDGLVDVDDAVARLREAGPLPHKRRALAFLRCIADDAGQPDVTR